MNNTVIGHACGESKKEAKHLAAADALQQLQQYGIPDEKVGACARLILKLKRLHAS